MFRRFSRHMVHRLVLGSLVVAALFVAPGPRTHAAPAAGGTYTNPLDMRTQDGKRVESCADPSIIHGQTPGDTAWYMYCTMDPLGSWDTIATGDPNFHIITMHRSLDLVHWTYVGDVFSQLPAWMNCGFAWAPDIRFFNGKYYLYYAAARFGWLGCSQNDSAIGVATSSSPVGPWTDSGAPVVEPHDADCCPGALRDVIDPAIVQDGGQRYIFYGTFFGGISARKLSADGFHSDRASQVKIAMANRYEGAYVIKRGDFWYLFASAGTCCDGALSAYNVFVGRSRSVLGPYKDRDNASFLNGRVGGTPIVSMNGNRFVGPGHNSIFTDFAGHDWFLYHAIDRSDPYFQPGFTKRPAMLDSLDWVDGWPTVHGGLGPSNTPQGAPAAQPGTTTSYQMPPAQQDLPGAQILSLSDEFSAPTLSTRWSWVRQPAADSYRVTDDGTFRFNSQSADLWGPQNDASVLTEPTPAGNYVVETRVKLDLPKEGCCYPFTQAGLVIYGDDDNYVKLDHVAIWDTRQTEFAKEVNPAPPGYPGVGFGSTAVGAPGEWTYLRIVKRTVGVEELYTPYTRVDGTNWVRGGTWTHSLGSAARIGLFSMGGGPFTGTFDYVRVYRLSN